MCPNRNQAGCNNEECPSDTLSSLRLGSSPEHQQTVDPAPSGNAEDSRPEWPFQITSRVV